VRAARLYGVGARLRETYGVLPMEAMSRRGERDVSSVRAALGEDRFEEAWAQGRAMTIDEALACALEAQGEAELAREG
jgi:hypothetical protein